VAGTRAAFIPDIQGSVIASLDSSSGALSKVGYLPYGKSANTMAPFGYTAQRIDPETNGLYYYRARHYSAAWGRFMQPDPVGYSGESHLYAYVNDDPLNNTDPSGQDLVGAVVGAFAGGYYGVLGAYSAGGGLTEAVIGGAVGAIAGSVIGALPPTLSVQTLTAVGGAAGFAGDITGQVIALALAGKPLADINWGSAAGATVGGAISGFGGAVLGRLALSTGAPPVLSAIAGASIPATPSVLLPIIGANIYNNLSGTPK